jgi:hypothetical protein
VALSTGEARSALKDIEKTENRTAASQHGRAAAPYLIMWGITWVIGYAVTASAPRLSWIWFALLAGGVVGSIILGVRQSRAYGRGGDFGWRYFGSFAMIAALIGALFAILPPLHHNQLSAFFPLVIGLFYAFVGIWTKGWRMLPLGLALMVLTVAGYFFLQQYFLYWMAAVGGGGLILGGLWMRSV